MAKYNEPIARRLQDRPNAGCDDERTELEPDAIGPRALTAV
jgi:hypothetical protein